MTYGDLWYPILLFVTRLVFTSSKNIVVFHFEHMAVMTHSLHLEEAELFQAIYYGVVSETQIYQS